MTVSFFVLLVLPMFLELVRVRIVGIYTIRWQCIYTIFANLDLQSEGLILSVLY